VVLCGGGVAEVDIILKTSTQIWRQLRQASFGRCVEIRSKMQNNAGIIRVPTSGTTSIIQGIDEHAPNRQDDLKAFLK
jgi:hypothetical protein